MTTMLAGPFAVGAACHAGSEEAGGPPDASLSDAHDTTDRDAGVHSDASIRPDASLDAASSRDAGGWDWEACAAETIDGAYIDNNPDGCSTFRYLPCGLPPNPLDSDPPTSQCDINLGICEEVCTTGPILFCLLSPVTCDEAGAVFPDASIIVDCVGSCGIAGRPPRGLRAPAASETGHATSAGSLGAYFAGMAYLEAASVRAFRDLERSLTDHGAPLRLRRSARRAGKDEERHARSARRLARRFGSTASRVRVGRVAAPSLVELLLDDAVTGCVAETFAALLATWQAAHAYDTRVRRAMTMIAADETRHAALAWEVLAWGLPRLSVPERARVHQALESAIAQLANRPASLDAETRRVTGYPTRTDERRLASELARLLRAEAIVIA